MMFDVVKLRAQVSFRYVEDARKLVFQIANFGSVRESILGLPKHSQARGCIQDLLVQVRRGIARDPDVVQVLERYAGFLEAITDRLLGETRAMLEAIETLLFGGGDQSAVFDDCR